MDKTKKILSVKVKRMMDDDPDTSWMGEYTNDPGEWNIDRRSGKYICEMDDDERIPERGREYRFFKPAAGDEKPGTEEYKSYGLQDFKRMESLCHGNVWFVGVRAEARVQLAGDLVQTITSGGIWGIESDSGPEYFKEVEDEQLSELRDELRAIGFTDAKIKKAFDDREEDD